MSFNRPQISSSSFVKKGQIADVFGPGSYKLDTNNLPILTNLGAWAYGFDSPFKAEVYL